MLDLYFVCRRYSSPMGGQPLPCPGGPSQQPAVLLDAFAILDSMEPPANE